MITLPICESNPFINCVKSRDSVRADCKAYVLPPSPLKIMLFMVPPQGPDSNKLENDNCIFCIVSYCCYIFWWCPSSFEVLSISKAICTPWLSTKGHGPHLKPNGCKPSYHCASPPCSALYYFLDSTQCPNSSSLKTLTVEYLDCLLGYSPPLEYNSHWNPQAHMSLFLAVRNLHVSFFLLHAAPTSAIELPMWNSKLLGAI